MMPTRNGNSSKRNNNQNTDLLDNSNSDVLNGPNSDLSYCILHSLLNKDLIYGRSLV